jgi:hypothetical protein
MNMEFIVNAVRDYLAGRLTRDELSQRAMNHRITTPFLRENYDSYANLLLDHIEQKLSAFPEESYSDDALKHILDVLEGRQPIQYHFVYVIPRKAVDKNIQELIFTADRFLHNFEQKKTYRVQIKNRLANGEEIYDYIETFFTQEEHDFCLNMQDILSNDTQETIPKSVARSILSIINRYIDSWESVTTYFASSEDVSGEILKKLERGILALSGKLPICVSLHGFVDNLNATIIL